MTSSPDSRDNSGKIGTYTDDVIIEILSIM